MADLMADAEALDELRAWCRSRPAEVQRIMRVLPPGASVRAHAWVRRLVPAPAEIGEVVSYFEDGGVAVRVMRRGRALDGVCAVADLEVVSYATHVGVELTPAWVEQALGGD